jgi:hypothetical protein
MRQAIRLFDSAEAGRKLTKKDLVTIQAEDILASRVFDDLHQTGNSDGNAGNGVAKSNSNAKAKSGSKSKK